MFKMRTIKEALLFWIRDKQQEEISRRQIQLMKNWFSLGKCTFDREELHEW